MKADVWAPATAVAAPSSWRSISSIQRKRPPAGQQQQSVPRGSKTNPPSVGDCRGRILGATRDVDAGQEPAVVAGDVGRLVLDVDSAPDAEDIALKPASPGQMGPRHKPSIKYRWVSAG
jgi:hypothetical protein